MHGQEINIIKELQSKRLHVEQHKGATYLE